MLRARSAPLAAQRVASALPPCGSVCFLSSKAYTHPVVAHRAERITFDHVGSTYLVHSGKEYKRVQVSSLMVNHKFGEFVLTRKSRPRPVKGKQGRGPR